MEIPIQVCVRIRPPPAAANDNNKTLCVKSIPGSLAAVDPESAAQCDDDANGNRPAAQLMDDGCSPAPPPQPTATSLIQVDHGVDSPPITFPFACTLAPDCRQDALYIQCAYPMLAMYMEGFDASFVTYGQAGAGKTHTMLGAATAIADTDELELEQDDDRLGLVQRWVRDLFALLAMHAERTFVLNIGWVEVLDDEIHDLLDGGGNVPCASAAEVLRWLCVGWRNRTTTVDGEAAGAGPLLVHSIFTLTLEQHWVTDGLIQHRLSTASFCDLAATRRRDVHRTGDAGEEMAEVLAQGVPEDVGLQVLDEIVEVLSASTAHAAAAPPAIAPPYARTTLTTLLKDSFGGRAQTLLILCVSALAADVTETLHNLRFAFRAQCVRQLVVLNAFSDNGRPLAEALASAAAAAANANSLGNGPLPLADELQLNHSDVTGGLSAAQAVAATPFGMQFAAAQLLKLASNAECLFRRLIESNGGANVAALDATDRARIEEWMFLKQECVDCLSSGELPPRVPSVDAGETEAGDEEQQLQQQQHLGRIEEETSDDDDDDVDHNDIANKTANDDNDKKADDANGNENENDDDDSAGGDSGESGERQRTTTTTTDSEGESLEYLHDRMAQLMDEFRCKTDVMVTEKYETFVARQPNAMLDSADGGRSRRKAEKPPPEIDEAIERTESPPALSPVAPRSGRRKTILPNDDDQALTDFERARLAAIASADGADENVPNLSLVVVPNADDPQNADSKNTDSTDEAFNQLLRFAAERDPLDKLDAELRKVRSDVVAGEQKVAKLTGIVQETETLVRTIKERQQAQCKQGSAGDAAAKKRTKLEADAAKTEKQLAKAMAALAKNGSTSAEVDRLQALAASKRQMFEEFVALNSGAELKAKRKEHQEGLKVARKELEVVQKELKKNRKREKELLRLAVKAVAAAPAATASDSTAAARDPTDVDARISHLDQVIAEKSNHLQRITAAAAASTMSPNDAAAVTADPERHEIRQLRRTRDELLHRRCSIDQLKRRKRLSEDEQRKLIECDESIDAIDAVIEYKNEMLCGPARSVQCTDVGQRERAWRLMMQRLNGLSVEEMRVLLYKYFQKVCDFRNNRGQLEQERDEWEMRSRLLANEVQQVRLEAQHREALKDQQHERTLAMYMRHVNHAPGSSMSDSMGSGMSVAAPTTTAAALPQMAMVATRTDARHQRVAILQQQQQQQHQHSRQLYADQPRPHQPQLYMNAAVEAALASQRGHHRGGAYDHQRLPSAEGAFMTPAHYAQYKPLDKYKKQQQQLALETRQTTTTALTAAATKTMSTTSKIFSRIRGGGGTATAKVQDSTSAAVALIPPRLLRHLSNSQEEADNGPKVKVTREKKKLVIRQTFDN